MCMGVYGETEKVYCVYTYEYYLCIACLIIIIFNNQEKHYI